jgi:hypothetical protein
VAGALERRRRHAGTRPDQDDAGEEVRREVVLPRRLAGCRIPPDELKAAGELWRMSRSLTGPGTERGARAIVACPDGPQHCRRVSVPSGGVLSHFLAWFKSLGASVTLFTMGVGNVLAANAGGSRICRRGGPGFTPESVTRL